MTPTDSLVTVFDWKDGMGPQIAQFLQEDLLCLRLGWVPGEGWPPNVYSRETLLRMLGMDVIYEDRIDPPLARKRTFGKPVPQTIHLGKIWIDRNQDELEASRKVWIILLYGRQYLEMVTMLAKRMATHFGVQVEVHLRGDERILCDRPEGTM